MSIRRSSVVSRFLWFSLVFYRLSIRQRRGKVVEVYDGRKWPVVSFDVAKTVVFVVPVVVRV